MRKDKFIHQINFSFGGGLICSMNDFQLSEYIQQRIRKQGKIPLKIAVDKVGPQKDGTWVFGPGIYVSLQGNLLNDAESSHIWIGHLFDGPGIAPQYSACRIEMPLSIDPLRELFEHVRKVMKHNFYPCVMAIACGALALHYNTILDKFLFCPVPLLYGDSGTGKTTALRCALSLMGISEQRFYSRGTTQKYVELCCDGILPLAIDDPYSVNAISELTIALFNGAKEGTIKRGTKTPTCMAMISANFTVFQQEK